MLTLIHHAVRSHRVLHNATNSADLLNAAGLGAYSNIMDAIKAANQSSEAADQALKVHKVPW